MATSFAVDIRPLFRDSPDVDSMQGYGHDLSSYEGQSTGARNLRPFGGREHALRRTLASRPAGVLQALDG